MSDNKPIFYASGGLNIKKETTELSELLKEIEEEKIIEELRLKGTMDRAIDLLLKSHRRR